MSVLFSIIIPTYNRARLISRAIESVLAQDFQDWEMIVVDDGSTDDTGEVVRSFVSIEGRISYHYSENQGAASARNFGCSFASGKYYTFLDSDDEYLASHLSIRSEMISAAPALELLHGNVEIIGDTMVADCFDPTKLIAISDCIIGGTFFIRRDLFQRLGGFTNLAYGDDNDFFRRATEIGALIKKVETPTYRYYRTEADSITALMARGSVTLPQKLKSHAERI
jgi:glycosyltransferase involved in cell wall biosynthesis